MQEFAVDVEGDGGCAGPGGGKARGPADEGAAIEHALAGREARPFEQPARGFGPADVVVLPEEVDPPGRVFIGE